MISFLNGQVLKQDPRDHNSWMILLERKKERKGERERKGEW